MYILVSYDECLFCLNCGSAIIGDKAYLTQADGDEYEVFCSEECMQTY